jgi:rod shape-determining protein MreC
MQQIINFIFRNKNFLLFLLLFSVSMVFTIQSHSYHKSKFVNSANFLAGGIYNYTHNVKQYFALKKINTDLQVENLSLRNVLINMNRLEDSISLDSSLTNHNYQLISATVIRNDYSKLDNFLLLNKGYQDSIAPDMGVFTANGIVGIVDKTSNGYSTVISILNSEFRNNAAVKRTNNYGTLQWNGKSPYVMQLTDVPKRAPIRIGDSIITGGRSSIFPKGIPIGTISDFRFEGSQDFYTIDVDLFDDMTNLEQVYVIKNLDKLEIDNLIKGSFNE